MILGDIEILKGYFTKCKTRGHRPICPVCNEKISIDASYYGVKGIAGVYRTYHEDCLKKLCNRVLDLIKETGGA